MKEFKSYKVYIRNENDEDIFEPVEIKDYPLPWLMEDGKKEYEDYQTEIILNNKIASELMARNEVIYRDNNESDLIEDWLPDGYKDKLCIPPKGYIRTIQEFSEAYNIKEVFPKFDEEKNPYHKSIAEHIQMTDWLIYMKNRLNIFGGIEQLVNKYAFINVASIIEAYIQEAAFNAYSYCKSCNGGKICPNNIDCRNYISVLKDKRAPIKKIIDEIEKYDLLGLNSEEIKKIYDPENTGDSPYDTLRKIFEKRNEVHIRRQETGNEPSIDNGQEDEESLYSTALHYMAAVSVACVKNMVPYYSSCRGYEKK